jgi:hypothetical protein
MASQFDLAPRLSALQGAGLNIASHYQSSPAQWLAHALDGVDVAVINCKGTPADRTPVLITLSKLEELVAQAVK